MPNPAIDGHTKRRYQLLRTWEPKLQYFFMSGVIFVALIIAQRFYQEPLYKFSVTGIPAI